MICHKQHCIRDWHTTVFKYSLLWTTHLCNWQFLWDNGRILNLVVNLIRIQIDPSDLRVLLKMGSRVGLKPSYARNSEIAKNPMRHWAMTTNASDSEMAQNSGRSILFEFVVLPEFLNSKKRNKQMHIFKNILWGF